MTSALHTLFTVFISALWISIIAVILHITFPKDKNYHKASKLHNAVRGFIQIFFAAPHAFISSIIIAIILGILYILPKFKIISESKSLPIRIQLSALWVLSFLYILEFWCNTHYMISFENKQYLESARKSNIISILNHGPTALDWLILLSTSDYYHRIGRAFAFMKKQFAYLPIVGWVGFLSGNITLNRKWEKDKERLSKLMPMFDHVYPQPWAFNTYPEGTRLTKKKLLQGQEFARKNGHVVYNNLLQPRVKGFRFLVSHLRNSVKYVVDWTVVYFNKAPTPQQFFLKARMNEYTHLHMRIYPINELPENDDEIDKWIRDRWTEKENLINNIKNGELKGEKMNRDCYQGRLCYIMWCFIIAFLMYLIGFNSLMIVIWTETALFVVYQTYFERSIDTMKLD